MQKFFNTAGPCRPEDHYMLPSSKRLPEVRDLIEQKMYFVLHAPRQVGKTTALLTLAKELTREGKYVSALVSMEVGAPFPGEPEIAEKAILNAWRSALINQLPEALVPLPWAESTSGRRIGDALAQWSRTASRPLVLFLDEIDSLQDQTLISVLRQLRDGYPSRPEGFPQSLALIGMRDVRDYKVKSGGSDRLYTASPFNVKVESITMRNFNREEVEELLLQHTHETGQVFAEGVCNRVFDLTQGQPWLVNALARQLIEFLVPTRTEAIECEHVERAKEILIQRQDTHLDSLAERLREDRVRTIIQPMLEGETLGNIADDDQRYIVDLGLCSLGVGGSLRVANPIYKEVIPRVLSRGIQRSMYEGIKPTWLDAQGNLVPEQLFEAFVKFWRQHAEALLGASPYPEVAPHLVLMAFLHRVSNGEGHIDREYAIGSRRMDLCIHYKGVRVAIELKVWRPKRKNPKVEGIEQLDGYLASLGLDFGWLVIFDQRPTEVCLEDRVSVEQTTSANGRAITIVWA